MTPTEVDNIRLRLQDPTETFTADEVNGYVEWVERQALTDSYNQARIADSMTKNTLRNETMIASISALTASVQQYQPPVISVFGGGQSE